MFAFSDLKLANSASTLAIFARRAAIAMSFCWVSSLRPVMASGLMLDNGELPAIAESIAAGVGRL